MIFYVIKFGEYFYRKDDQIMNSTSISMAHLLQEACWFYNYEDAKKTAKKFGGKVKKIGVTGLEDVEEELS